MNDLAIRESGSVMVLPEQVDLIRRTVANGATKDELELYFYDCQRQGVHPLDKLIHFTKRGGRYVPITSIDYLRMKAGSTQVYAGSDDAIYGGTPGTKGFEAKVTVYRIVQGQRCAWSATARWDEYFPGEAQGHMWKKMPHVMLAKCAEALALRKGFADVLHGLYIREEMDQAEKPARDTRSLKEKVQAKLVTVEAAPPVEHSTDAAQGASEPSAELPRQHASTSEAPSNSNTYILKIGRQKNQPVADQTDENLQWCLNYYLDKIRDQPNSKYKDEWEEAVLALEEEKSKRQ